jgi:protein O-GlcNAc transferase
MQQGIQYHADGRLVDALVAFETAMRLVPANENAITATATLLSALDRPMAAYTLLRSIESQLMTHADGAANLAIAAEACGDISKAWSAYQRALELDEHHLRALNNSGLLAAQKSQWDIAIAYGRKCVEIDGSQVSYQQQLSDFLMAARLYDEALEQLDAASQRFPGHSAVAIRQIAVLAFKGEFEQVRDRTSTLDAEGQIDLKEFVARLATARDPDHKLRPSPDAPADALQLYLSQAFEAMANCDWRGQQKLVETIREMLVQAQQTGHVRDWRDAQFYGLMLDLREEELAQMRRQSSTAIASSVSRLQPGLQAYRQYRLTSSRDDGRIHVGLAVKSLHDNHYANALKRRLDLHDTSRFALHVYSPTRVPLQTQTDPLRRSAASIVETAHMTHVEAAGRIRLDQLDIFVDAAFDSPWCRPEIPTLRVAPVQIRELTWHRHHPPQPCDYNISDRFIHPDGLDLTPYGAVVRLPQTCWLAAMESGTACSKTTRSQAGLPDNMLVFGGLVHAVTLDPQTFAIWMKILRSLPDAVLWLPAYPMSTAAHLVREAEAAGVSAGRLLFAMPMTREDTLACFQHVDLFLDPLRFSAAGSLEDALRLGVPAISCAGNSMASRLGGSILHAAGLGECVLADQHAYVTEAIRLGRHARALAALRTRVAAACGGSALFDLASRVTDWESAWTMMAERSRAGLPPVAFDVMAPGSSQLLSIT